MLFDGFLPLTDRNSAASLQAHPELGVPSRFDNGAGGWSLEWWRLLKINMAFQTRAHMPVKVRLSNPYWNPRPIERLALRAMLQRAWEGSQPRA